VGVYGDVGFSYKDWLYLNLTGRNDWSSTLPQSKRSYFYPGASLAWIFSSALKTPKWLSYGKLRVASATVGKDADPYLLNSVFTTGSIGDGYANSLIRSPYGTVTGYERGNRIGNPNLKPEFTSSNEIGIELPDELTETLDKHYAVPYIISFRFLLNQGLKRAPQ
jgi:outer membrane receptor protein involved in Fe transport